MPEFFNRPPRIQPELPTGEITIPNPPTTNPNGGRLGLLTLGLPLVTILGYALVASRGGSPLAIIPMGLAAVVTSVVGYLTWQRNQRNEQTKQANYSQTLRKLREEIRASHKQQQTFYDHNFPSLDALMHMADSTSTHLWERRPEDIDFGMLRMGVGRQRSTVTLKPPSNDNADAPQLADALKLVDEFQYIPNSAIALSLRRIHAIGITGNEHGLTTDFVRTLLAHLVALHSPNDTRLYIIGAPPMRTHWNWTRWLPHCNTSRNDQVSGEQLCFDPDQVANFWGNIQQELEKRQLRLQADEKANVSLPFMVVLVDLFSDQTSSMQNVTAEAAVSLLLHEGAKLGAAVIFLVPDYKDTPSECGAIVKIDTNNQKAYFNYAEVGVNTMRLNGEAERLDIQRAENFAIQLARLSLRTTYGADLPHSLSLLDLIGERMIDAEALFANWQNSRNSDGKWPEVSIGMSVGNKPRNLIFSAVESGVHGLVAGTTGTGKSELLMTLIVGLTANYSPDIVNLVLVDYKGGTAFDSFRELPHAVDVITNLQGQAGTRAFSAIRAELNRRAQVLADAKVSDIVGYRSRGLHLITPLPHLFVIIDEFAEMIKERPEFKAQLDGIARLGRALGVHLILATQRPSGVVSDQIRANMKFRLCLRVETPEDSRELLGRTDAAFLPQNIPGRAYLQIGNDNVELIQVARVGGNYQGRRVDTQPPVIWLNRVNTTPVLPSSAGSQFETLSDVHVRLAKQVMEDHDELPRPRKPWPDPLPETLALNTINPAVGDWLDDQGSWRGIDWNRQTVSTLIGLLDNPSQAEQGPLALDLSMGHVVVFGASGWGKTTLLRTIIVGLAAIYSPAELQFYFLDFGGRGLDVFQKLPHLGASITPTDSERVQRLLRKLGNILEERKTLLSHAQSTNVYDYNAKRPEDCHPAIILILDNFAQFRENFPDELDIFTTLARDGRAYGIHFIVTAEQVNSIPGKIYSLFTERLAFKLADNTEYSSIVGRGVPEIAEIPGRGFVRRERTPLEFQTAMPIGPDNIKGDIGSDESVGLNILCEKMAAMWHGVRPEAIDVLPSLITLHSLPTNATTNRINVAIGRQDFDLSTVYLDLGTQGPHFVVTGPPLSGKTTVLRTLALGLADQYSPAEIALVLIDFQQKRLFRYGDQSTLGNLPHVLANVSELPELESVIESLRQEFTARQYHTTPRPQIFVLIDNYDDMSSAIGTNRPIYARLGDLARQFGVAGLRIIVAGSLNIARGNDDFMKQVVAPRFGLGLDSNEAPIALGARMRAGQVSEFPVGRGYIVKSGRAQLIQTATPQDENMDIESSLDKWVETICSRSLPHAEWLSAPLSEG